MSRLTPLAILLAARALEAADVPSECREVSNPLRGMFTRRLAACALVLTLGTACSSGNECGPGTQEQDGQCMSSGADGGGGAGGEDGGGGGGDEKCPIGSMHCACTSGGACDLGLECVAEQCLAPECPCDEGAECDFGCACDSACVGHKRVFVTRQKWTGDLAAAGVGADGAEAADSLCMGAAVDLGGTWLAWISIEPGAGEDAADRFTATGPWHLVGSGDVVFSSIDDLETSTRVPNVGIDRDEHGELVVGTTVGDLAVWTGTPQTGGFPGHTCSLFTSNDKGALGTIGQAGRIDAFWTDGGGGLPCDVPSRLYCFEQ